MARKELVKFGSITLIFVLTNFLMKDLFKLEGVHWTIIIGAVSAIISFLLVEITSKNFSLTTQIIITIIYCLSALLIGNFFVKNNNQREELTIVKKEKIVDEYYNDLIGTWFAPKKSKEESNLKLVFTKKDSLTTFVNDSMKLIFLYKITRNGRIKVKDIYGNDKFNWEIIDLDSSNLEIGDGEQRLIFKRIN